VLKLSIQLEIVKGPARGRVFSGQLEHEQDMTVGRKQPVEVWLPKANVSRCHCTLTNRNGLLELNDQSSNSTIVNGEPVNGSRVLAPGDILLIGPFHLHLTIHDEESPLFGDVTREEDLEDSLHGDPAFSEAADGYATGYFQSISPHVGSIFGDCRIMHSIGEGSTSEVFQARRLDDDGVVAVKVSAKLSSMTEEAIERFRRESVLLKQLDHPRIMRVFESGEKNGVLYMICEYLGGRTLHMLLQRRGELSLSVSLRIAAQLVEGLGCAAEQGIIHRDINPRNLFIRVRNKKLGVKVIDFGLGKQLGETGKKGGITTPGEGFGTPGYMAPEQIERAKNADLRSDVYGVGAVLFRMLVGRPPRIMRDWQQFMQEMKRGIPSLAELAPACPPALVELVDRCLRADPSKRFQEYDTLLAELSALLAYVSSQS